ncbi:unnamed protein product [Closterium sp. Naga37s-1]|nr:unnamed protein product [Closterium sp. Naga37s-1]
MEEEADSPLLRFLIDLLKPISEADPALLANYVVALLKNSKPHDELRRLCLDQLQDFLTDETEGFVAKLFDALERGEISLEDAEEETAGEDDDADKKRSRGDDAEPAETNESARDGGRGGGRSGGRRGDGGQRGADEEGDRGRGGKRSGTSRERGVRERASGDEEKERDEDKGKGGERGERESYPAAEAEAEERAEAGGEEREEEEEGRRKRHEEDESSDDDDDRNHKHRRRGGERTFRDEGAAGEGARSRDPAEGRGSVHSRLEGARDRRGGDFSGGGAGRSFRSRDGPRSFRPGDGGGMGGRGGPMGRDFPRVGGPGPGQPILGPQMGMPRFPMGGMPGGMGGRAGLLRGMPGRFDGGPGRGMGGEQWGMGGAAGAMPGMLPSRVGPGIPPPGLPGAPMPGAGIAGAGPGMGNGMGGGMGRGFFPGRGGGGGPGLIRPGFGAGGPGFGMFPGGGGGGGMPGMGGGRMGAGGGGRGGRGAGEEGGAGMVGGGGAGSGGPTGKRARCPDFEEKGFCLKGDLCPLDHGNYRIVVEDMQSLQQLNLPLPPQSLGMPPNSAAQPPPSQLAGTRRPRAEGGRGGRGRGGEGGGRGGGESGAGEGGEEQEGVGVSAAVDGGEGVMADEGEHYDPDEALWVHDSKRAKGMREVRAYGGDGADGNGRMPGGRRGAPGEVSVWDRIGPVGAGGRGGGGMGGGDGGMGAAGGDVGMEYTPDGGFNMGYNPQFPGNFGGGMGPEFGGNGAGEEGPGMGPGMGQGGYERRGPPGEGGWQGGQGQPGRGGRGDWGGRGRGEGGMGGRGRGGGSERNSDQKAHMTVFVNGIPSELTAGKGLQASLIKHFSKFGPVVDIKVHGDKGRAFVQLGAREHAAAAIAAPDAVLGNRFIKVFWANFDLQPDPASAAAAAAATAAAAAAAAGSVGEGGPGAGTGVEGGKGSGKGDASAGKGGASAGGSAAAAAAVDPAEAAAKAKAKLEELRAIQKKKEALLREQIEKRRLYLERLKEASQQKQPTAAAAAAPGASPGAASGVSTAAGGSAAQAATGGTATPAAGATTGDAGAARVGAGAAGAEGAAAGAAAAVAAAAAGGKAVGASPSAPFSPHSPAGPAPYMGGRGRGRGGYGGYGGGYHYGWSGGGGGGGSGWGRASMLWEHFSACGEVVSVEVEGGGTAVTPTSAVRVRFASRPVAEYAYMNGRVLASETTIPSVAATDAAPAVAVDESNVSTALGTATYVTATYRASEAGASTTGAVLDALGREVERAWGRGGGEGSAGGESIPFFGCVVGGSMAHGPWGGEGEIMGEALTGRVGRSDAHGMGNHSRDDADADEGEGEGEGEGEALEWEEVVMAAAADKVIEGVVLLELIEDADHIIREMAAFAPHEEGTQLGEEDTQERHEAGKVTGELNCGQFSPAASPVTASSVLSAPPFAEPSNSFAESIRAITEGHVAQSEGAVTQRLEAASRRFLGLAEGLQTRLEAPQYKLQGLADSIQERIWPNNGTVQGKELLSARGAVSSRGDGVTERLEGRGEEEREVVVVVCAAAMPSVDVQAFEIEGDAFPDLGGNMAHMVTSNAAHFVVAGTGGKGPSPCTCPPPIAAAPPCRPLTAQAPHAPAHHLPPLLQVNPPNPLSSPHSYSPHSSSSHPIPLTPPCGGFPRHATLHATLSATSRATYHAPLTDSHVFAATVRPFCLSPHRASLLTHNHAVHMHRACAASPPNGSTAGLCFSLSPSAEQQSSDALQACFTHFIRHLTLPLTPATSLCASSPPSLTTASAALSMDMPARGIAPPAPWLRVKTLCSSIRAAASSAEGGSSGVSVAQAAPVNGASEPTVSAESGGAGSSEGKAAVRKRLVSGVQPTGSIHLGNYLGAIKNWIPLQDECDTFLFVVDLHAITLPHDVDDLSRSSRTAAAMYLACGVDPSKATVFVQSHVRAHAELTWLLSCTTPMSWLNKMIQFKEKARKAGEDVGTGLLTYPLLMAADILLYQCDVVPVGEDQRQHLELTRDVAARINNLYGGRKWKKRGGRGGRVFKVPEAMIPPAGARIMSLTDGTSKMSKSAPSDMSRINLLDPPQVIANKIKRCKTDSFTGMEFGNPERPECQNLLSIYQIVTGRTKEEVEQEVGALSWGQFKPLLADALVAHLEPIQKRYEEVTADAAYLDEVLAGGAARANEIADRTLRDTYDALGFLAPPRR